MQRCLSEPLFDLPLIPLYESAERRDCNVPSRMKAKVKVNVEVM